MRGRFIDDLRGSWKLFSTWVAGAWATFLGYCAFDPSVLITIWNTIPADLRGDLPPWLRGVILAAISFGTWYAARVIKQPALRKDRP